MLKNYFMIAIRSLLRHKVYSSINVVGLAIGMACCILIAQYIRFELSYDAFQSKADRIYRVVRETRSKGGDISFDMGTSGNLAPALLEAYPEIEQAVRIWSWGAWIQYGDKGMYQNIAFVDQDFLNVFDFPFIKGDLETAFKDPLSIVITERIAKNYFGDEDPMGKVISVEDRYFAPDYTVTGVLKDMPDNTSMYVGCLVTTLSEPEPISIWHQWAATYSWRPIQTYLVLPDGYQKEDLEQKLPALMEQYMGAEIRKKNRYHLQPFKRIHLYERVDYNMGGQGDINHIYTFLWVAVFILIIACINFMNLATARSVHRAREVGLRKVVGAVKKQLMGQFLGESLMLTFLALPIAFVLGQLALPLFSNYVNRSLASSSSLDLLPLFVAFAIVVGLLAGCYPAFYLSSYEPVDVLKGSLRSGKKGAWLRKGLVVFQFGASIVLIISTAVIYLQLSYMRDKDLGFDKENVVMMPLFSLNREVTTRNEDRLSHRHNLVKNELLKHPGITETTAFRMAPGVRGGVTRVISAEGITDSNWRMYVNEVDEDFFAFFGIELLAGRNFSADIASDSTSAFILNETAVKQLGWDNLLGKAFGFDNKNMHGVVVGVVKDFHQGSLQEKIKPVAFCMRRMLFNYVALKIRPNKLQEALPLIEKTWKNFVPNRSFDYWFLDEDIQWAYFEEQRFGEVATVFAGLAIFVACLGLLGLAAFMAEQRTKEIGVRKVLGASVGNIIYLLSKEFVVLVLISNLIAWPVAYMMMTEWLRDFAYHIELSVLIFVGGGLLALLIALGTVSVLAFRAARSNPVTALRYE